MAHDDSFDGMLNQLQAGDPQAAREVWQRFHRHMMMLAHKRLDDLTRQKVDAEDVVQSAYKSFFKRFQRGQYDLASWDDLGGLLVRITLRKCHYQRRHFRTEGRNLKRERRLERSTTNSAVIPELVSREASPDEGLVLAELFEDLLAGFADRDQKIVCLSLQGHSELEIAEQLDCTERTVQRILRRVRRHLESLRQAETLE